jgi:hypothetical protein
MKRHHTTAHIENPAKENENYWFTVGQSVDNFSDVLDLILQASSKA